MKSILVTGASGFIGEHLVPALLNDGWRVRVAVRKPLGQRLPAAPEGSSIEEVVIGDIRSYDGWDKALDGVDVVAHLAGLAHDIGASARWTADDYMAVNAEATETLARAAARAGVRKLVYISSIKVNGEHGGIDRPFDEDSPPNPQDDYSRSKLEAEKALRAVEAETGLGVVVIRPPIVYGAKVAGNMGKLFGFVTGRRLIMTPAIDNLRSFIYAGNLVDAIVAAIRDERANGRTYVVSDGADMSTRELIRRIIRASGRKTLVAPIPIFALALFARAGDAFGRISGRGALFNTASLEKLKSSLRIDQSRIENELGWKPSYTVDEGLKESLKDMPPGGKAPGWLDLWIGLGPVFAWLVASVVRFDYFMAAGGVKHYLGAAPVVAVVQYLVYFLMGFWWGAPAWRRGYKIADLVKVSLMGAIAVAAALFFFDRLYGVSRTALVVYPLVHFAWLAMVLFVAGRLGGASSRPHDAEEDAVRMEPGPSSPAARSGAHDGKAVSIIIVNYNAGELLTECVRSALQSTVPVEVIVSDNGSSDGSVDYLRSRFGSDQRLLIVENGANLGFAKANNKVMSQASGDYMLFLNPDCIIEPDTVERMENLMEANPDAGMAGCLIKNLDGSEQAGCRRKVPTPWRTFVRVLHLDKLFPNHERFKSFVLVGQPLPEGPVHIEALSGAFMFIRREALDQVGELDESYFMHCEDLDWCMRFRQADWKILFTPEVEITHVMGTCSRDIPITVLLHKHNGMVKFYRKFFRRQYPLPFMWTVIAAVWIRFAVLSLMLVMRRGMSGFDEDV